MHKVQKNKNKTKLRCRDCRSDVEEVKRVSQSEKLKQKATSCEGPTKIKKDALVMSKKDFVLVVVDVINCTTQIDKKTEQILNCEGCRQIPGNHESRMGES